MSFSTWRFLLPDKDPGRKHLWTAAISQAFPGLTRPPVQLVAAVAGVYDIRNRVAHLEPMLDVVRIKDQYTNMREVIGEISHEVEQWFVSNQRVTTFLKNRPLSD
jgi:hypothetical protein